MFSVQMLFYGPYLTGYQKLKSRTSRCSQRRQVAVADLKRKTMRLSFLLCLSSLFFAGCASHEKVFQGGGVEWGPFIVTLESITPVGNSPIRGAIYPVPPFAFPEYPSGPRSGGIT